MNTETVRGIQIEIPDNYYVVHNKSDTVQKHDKRYNFALSEFIDVDRNHIRAYIHLFICIIRPKPSAIGWNIRELLKNSK